MTDPQTLAVLEAALPKCRTFSADGQHSLCDQPGRYIAWGDLYNKMDRGPKCFKHLPRTAKQGGVLGFGSPAIFDLLQFGKAIAANLQLLPAVEAAASLDEVEQALFAAQAAGTYTSIEDLQDDSYFDPQG